VHADELLVKDVDLAVEIDVTLERPNQHQRVQHSEEGDEAVLAITQPGRAAAVVDHRKQAVVRIRREDEVRRGGQVQARKHTLAVRSRVRAR
jgi:hypothetical protein